MVVSVKVCPGTRLCALSDYLCRTARAAEDDISSSRVIVEGELDSPQIYFMLPKVIDRQCYKSGPGSPQTVVVSAMAVVHCHDWFRSCPLHHHCIIIQLYPEFPTRHCYTGRSFTSTRTIIGSPMVLNLLVLNCGHGQASEHLIWLAHSRSSQHAHRPSAMLSTPLASCLKITRTQASSLSQNGSGAYV